MYEYLKFFPKKTYLIAYWYLDIYSLFSVTLLSFVDYNRNYIGLQLKSGPPSRGYYYDGIGLF